MWKVYIIQCKDSKLYTGSTTDIDRRLKEHNAGKGGRFTRFRKPVKLMYQEKVSNRSKAQIREAEIKKLTRTQKLQLMSCQKKT